MPKVDKHCAVPDAVDAGGNLGASTTCVGLALVYSSWNVLVRAVVSSGGVTSTALPESIMTAGVLVLRSISD